MLAQSAGLPTSATACFSVRLTTKRTTRRAGMAAAVPVLGVATDARPLRPHLPPAKTPQAHGLAVPEGLFDRGEDCRHRFFCLHLGAPEFLGNPLDQLRFPHAATLLVTWEADVCCFCSSPPSRGMRPSSTG